MTACNLCTLNKLVKNLSNNDFKYLLQEFSGDLLELVKQEGVYPYEYVDNFERFSEDKLPDRPNFFSSVKNKHFREKKTSVNVWNTFKMNTMGDYHHLYLNTDDLLLADDFEKFIVTCLEYYGLDPGHYFSSPGLCCDAMFKMNKIQLEFISSIDAYLFVEKEMRGGISYIAKRYSRANNKSMKSYDPNNPSKYIKYLDAKNLYSQTMRKYLPYGRFKWLNQNEIDGLVKIVLIDIY